MATSNLETAIRDGDLEACRRIIAVGAHVNGFISVSGGSDTVLCFAIQQLMNRSSKPSIRQIIRLLLEKGADPFKQSLTNIYDRYPREYEYVERVDNSAVHLAVNYNDLELVQLLMQHTTYKDIHNDRRETPLYIASIGRAEILKLLLSKQTNADLSRPLQRAIQTSNTENVKVFLQYLTAENLSPSYGYLLNDAVTHGTPELIDVLIQKNVHKFSHAYLLHAAIRGQKEENFMHVLQTGLFDINQRDEFGQTPLVEAAKRDMKYFDVVMKQPGVQVDLMPHNKAGVLYLLLLNGNFERALEVLKISKRHINTKTGQGQTPLHAIISSDCYDPIQKLEHVKTLVKLGAKPFQAGTLLYATAAKGLVELLEYFMGKLRLKPLEGLNNGAMTALCGAVIGRTPQMIKVLHVIFVYGGITTEAMHAAPIRKTLETLPLQQRQVLNFYTDTWACLRVLWIAWVKGRTLQSAMEGTNFHSDGKKAGFHSLPWPVFAEILRLVVEKTQVQWDTGTPPNFSFK